jgi:TIR domain/Yip1 domain
MSVIELDSDLAAEIDCGQINSDARPWRPCGFAKGCQPVIVFLSYASEQRDIADQIKLALGDSGHEVFFDRDSLPAGDDYHPRIRKAVENSDAFVFLISPQSVAQGCYALTELKYAREKWPNPRGKLLPVMIEKTDYRQIPPYLKAISVLEPEGNAPAEIAAEIQKWDKGTPNVIKRNVARFIAVLARPRSFIRSIDYNAEHTLIDASVFAVFISVIELIMVLPAYRLANIKADTLTYVLIEIITTLVFWFLYGSVYHLCARLIGGRGTYQSSIVAFLYLTAFVVIGAIFSLPVAPKTISFGLETSLAPSRLSQWGTFSEQMLQSPTGLICNLLILATALYRWICTIGVFMIIHEVGRLKGVFIGLLGAALSWVVFIYIQKPAMDLLWRAFSC